MWVYVCVWSAWASNVSTALRLLSFVFWPTDLCRTAMSTFCLPLPKNVSHLLHATATSRGSSAGYLRLPRHWQHRHRQQLAAGHQVLQVKPSAVQAHTSQSTMAIKHKYFTGGGTDKRPCTELWHEKRNLVAAATNPTLRSGEARYIVSSEHKKIRFRYEKHFQFVVQSFSRVARTPSLSLSPSLYPLYIFLELSEVSQTWNWCP